MPWSRRFASPIDYLDVDPPPQLAQVARAILDYASGSPSGGETSIEISDQQWPRLWARLAGHRVRSYLSPLVADQHVRVPHHVEDEVRAEARRMAHQHLHIAAAARQMADLLTSSGIDFRVLKGLATAVLDHRKAGLRQTSDVDLLVRPGDFDRACRAIASSGASKMSSTEVETTFRGTAGVEIDLHHRLFRFGRVDDAVLFDDPEPLPNGLGHALPAIARLVHASAHLMIKPPGRRRLSSLVDVELLRGSDKVDMAAALDLARQFGVDDLLRHSCWLADSVGRADPGEPPASARSLINLAYLRTRRNVMLETLAVLQDRDGVRERALYLAIGMRKLRSG